MPMHTINKQVYDFNYASESVASTAQKQLLTYTVDDINRLIGAVLDEEFDENEYHFIDRIDLDLGNLSMQDLGSDIVLIRLKEALTDRLHKTRHGGTLLSDQQSTAFTVVKSFLTSGDLPWWLDKTNEISLDEWLAKLLNANPRALYEMVEMADSPQTVLQRLLTHYCSGGSHQENGFVNTAAAINEIFKTFMFAGIDNGHLTVENDARRYLFEKSTGWTTSASAALSGSGQPIDWTKLSDKLIRRLKLSLTQQNITTRQQKTITLVNLLIEKNIPEKLIVLHALRVFDDAAINAILQLLAAATRSEPFIFPKKVHHYFKGVSLYQLDGLLAIAEAIASGRYEAGATKAEGERGIFKSGYAGTNDRNEILKELQHGYLPGSNTLDIDAVAYDKDGFMIRNDKINTGREAQPAAGEINPLIDRSSGNDALPVGADKIADVNTDADTAIDAQNGNSNISAAGVHNNEMGYEAATGAGSEGAYKKNERIIKTDTRLTTEYTGIPAFPGQKSGRIDQPGLRGETDAPGSLDPSAEKWSTQNDPDLPVRFEDNSADQAANMQPHETPAFFTQQSFKKEKAVAYIVNKLDLKGLDTGKIIMNLPDQVLFNLQKKFLQLEKNIIARKKTIRKILSHKYFLEYNLLSLLVETNRDATRAFTHTQALHDEKKPGIHDKSATPLNTKAAASLIQKKIAAFGDQLTTHLRHLPQNEGVIIKDVLDKKRMSSQTEKKIFQRLLTALPNEAIGFLEFFTGLEEEEIKKMLSPVSSQGNWQPGKRPATQEKEATRAHITNAGLCLLAPYLPSFFRNLGLLEDDEFKSVIAAQKAVHLLQYIAGGQKRFPEYLLQLNKLLCGFSPADPLAGKIRLTKKDMNEANALLGAVIGNWPALRSTSIEGFQNSFLLRKGILSEQEQTWTLQVEKKGFDILIDSIPWSFNIVRFPWMKKHITTEW